MDYTQGLKLAKVLNLTVAEDLDDAEAHGLCVYWDHLIRLKPSLGEDKMLHVLLHEIAHYTGSEHLLARETLLKYGHNELYALVEEAIAEGVAVTLLLSYGLEPDTGPFNYITQLCDDEGIEYDIDVLPEIERIVNYLTPNTKGL